MIKILLLSLDIVVAFATWHLASYIISNDLSLTFKSLNIVSLIFLTIQIFISIKNGLYKSILKYASFHFANTIIKAVSLASILNLGITYLFFDISWNIYLIQYMLFLTFVGFSRFFPRYYFYVKANRKKSLKRALIYGAGDLGETVVRDLLNSENEYRLIGFIDDDIKKKNQRVHNLPILGGRNELKEIIKKHKIDEIILSFKNISSHWLRSLIRECRDYNVFCHLAPKISSDGLNLANIDVKDLLKRNPKDLDEKQISQFLKNKKILITGAGGSIGSELVKQCLKFSPSKIILIENSEYNLYKIEEQTLANLKSSGSKATIKACLMDLCNNDSLQQIMIEEKPNIVFHAAAYKHVPLLEQNPFSGIINNLKSTINIVSACNQNKVEKFVLISTDKAVKPRNFMGATKRLCELYIQNFNLLSDTEYVAVRFGNVLGSSGSVIPKFLSQIKNGKNITVTHRDMTRYFMLIDEAVKLVMQAASIGNGGEIFILNMGKPVKILEMAEDLIYLSGKKVGRDISIEFTGLRPGEKLHEELLIDDTEKKTQYENITIGKMTPVDWEKFNILLKNLIEAAREGSYINCLNKIQEIIPEFEHENLESLSDNKTFHLSIAK